MRYAFALLALSLAGCSYGSDANKSPTSDSLPPVPISRANDQDGTSPPAPSTMGDTAAATTTPAAWPAPFAPPAAPCIRVATQAATVWTRPATAADKFGQLAKGERVRLTARTADGWVGFSPGTAQAANVGVFRLRWVRAAEAFAPGDSCASLPLVTTPPLGCVLMAERATTVRAQPSGEAASVSSIPAGSYARVVKTNGPWVEIFVPGRELHGYVAQADASLSGPCQ